MTDIIISGMNPLKCTALQNSWIFPGNITPDTLQLQVRLSLWSVQAIIIPVKIF